MLMSAVLTLLIRPLSREVPVIQSTLAVKTSHLHTYVYLERTIYVT